MALSDKLEREWRKQNAPEGKRKKSMKRITSQEFDNHTDLFSAKLNETTQALVLADNGADDTRIPLHVHENPAFATLTLSSLLLMFPFIILWLSRPHPKQRLLR